MPVTTDKPSDSTNRLLDAVLLHTKQEAAYRISNPAGRREDPVAQALKQAHYQSVGEAYRKDPRLTSAERSTLRYIRHALRRHRLSRTPLLYQLAYRAGSWVVNTALGRRSNILQHRRQLANFEKGTIIEQNVLLLTENTRSAGFALVPEQALRQHLQHQLPRFDVRYADPNYPKTDFVLHFKRLKGADAYYFEGFDAIARPTLRDVLQASAKSLRLSFSMLKEPAFTAQEAVQLVAGRPVQKEVAGQSQWFSPHVNSLQGESRPAFDLSRALAELPIKEMKQAISRNNLLAALQSGAQRPVTLLLPSGKEEKALVSVTADANGVQLHTPDGRYLDLHDYTKRLSEAQNQLQQLPMRKLHPVTEQPKTKMRR